MMPATQTDYAQSPHIVMWEITRACQLHCVHCRAEAQRHRHPGELNLQEARSVVDQVSGFHDPLLVITGGDPLEREDLWEIIDYAREQGVRVSLAASVTPRMTRAAIWRMRRAGVKRLALSLDGATAKAHDRFRGVKGSFLDTVKALYSVADIGLPLQINTTVSALNHEELEGVADMAELFGADLWSLFFLVPTGRASEDLMTTPEQNEEIMKWIYGQSLTRPFAVKATEAPFYRRVIMQRQSGEARREPHPGSGQTAQRAPRDALRGVRPVNDGDGFVFISHTGDVYPSGFLPECAGNVQSTPLVDIYRASDLFRKMRAKDELKGKCGRCEFRHVCGGSRARAFAVTGDYMQSDPACSYQPQG